MQGKYKAIYDSSISQKENFWKEVAESIFWYKKPTKILNSSNPPFYKWYEDGVTNTCYNAIDFHIDNGRGEKLAIIYDSPITDSKKLLLTINLKKKFLYLQGHLKIKGLIKVTV